METKHKTLAECRNIIVENLLEWRLDISTDNGECREYSKLSSEQAKEIADAIIFDFEHKKPINEAAELYAGQTKQSEPVSIDIIDEAVRFRDNFDYTSCLTSTGIKTGEAVMNSFIAGAKWQSQQQSANAELKEKCSNLVELNSTMINQQFEYEKQIAELKKQNAELVEALDKLLQLALSNGCEYDCDNDCEFPEVERASELISKHTT